MPKRLRFYLEGEAPKSPFQHSTGPIFRWPAESDFGLVKLLYDANQVKPLAISPGVATQCIECTLFGVRLPDAHPNGASSGGMSEEKRRAAEPGAVLREPAQPMGSMLAGANAL
jgi:hypothetical protein